MKLLQKKIFLNMFKKNLKFFKSLSKNWDENYKNKQIEIKIKIGEQKRW